MNLLSSTSNSFFTDEKTTKAFNDLIKSARHIKKAIEFFKAIIAKNPTIDLINNNIFNLIDLIAELDRKVLAILPELLSNRDEYSDHKLMRNEMYIRLGLFIKFGDKLLIHCTEYDRQNAAKENFIYDYLTDAIEDYVNEVKRTINQSSEIRDIDYIDGRFSVESEGHYQLEKQTIFEKEKIKSNYSNNSNLSWCDDEEDLRLFKNRGFLRESNTSRGSKTDSKESGFSEEISDLDTESTDIPVSNEDYGFTEYQSTWKEFVSSRSQRKPSSASRMTFRASFYSLPSKGKEIVYDETVEMPNSKVTATADNDEVDKVVLRNSTNREKVFGSEDSWTIVPELDNSKPNQPDDANFLEYETVEQYLWKENDENGSRVRGGTIDGLIVYACNNKQKDYTDTFITTYKSFIGSRELVEKLMYRFEYFINKKQENAEYYRIAKKTFALLLIVVSELTNLDLCIYFLEYLIESTCRIIGLDQIKLGRVFRQCVITQIFNFHKLAKLDQNTNIVDSVSPINTLKYTSLLDIKPEILAQQICLMTHQIICNIRSSELLLYIDKQDIEIAPNFSALANYFNSLSFWAATAILKENKNRNRLIFFFIRVMQKLLEYRNFESCAALNSTFCHVSIYRILPDIKELDEFIELFDPSMNFKIYRERIVATEGTCIPILFLLIRDLIHIETGNPNELHGLINYSKRYQMYNSLAKFRNAKRSPYKFKKNFAVLNFVNNFSDYWHENKLIEKSYALKSRGENEEYESEDGFFTLLTKCM